MDDRPTLLVPRSVSQHRGGVLELVHVGPRPRVGERDALIGEDVAEDLTATPVICGLAGTLYHEEVFSLITGARRWVSR